MLHVQEWGRYRLLGETRDDAAGEAFDKVAKLLGLPYPGGPAIQEVAEEGSRTRHRLPRPLLNKGQELGSAGYYDFSFSGLKTAVATLVSELSNAGKLANERAHVAACFQEAAIDVLASKTMRAVEATHCPRVLLGGGVAANQRLREELAERLGPDGRLFAASNRLSLDNGAMVARAALFRLERDEVAPLDASANARLSFPGLISE